MPFGTQPKYPFRDNDASYGTGSHCSERVAGSKK